MTEENTTEETADGGETIASPKEAKKAPAKRKPRKKTPAKSAPKEEVAEADITDHELETVFVPRSPITAPPLARPSIMRVQILKNAAGYYRNELHDLEAEKAEDLVKRKIAIRILPAEDKQGEAS